MSSPTSGTRRFLYDGDALVAEYDPGSGSGTGLHTINRRHVHWPGADLPMVTYQGEGLGTIRQLLADHQGSIVALADASGAAVQINRYDEYGIPGGGNSGTFQYTGQMWLPELGMYHYKARIYSPTLGRFLQVDPIGYQGGNNLYAYVGDDPVNEEDPTGNCPLCVKVAVDFGIEVATQYATTGEVHYGQAALDTAIGLINPFRTIERARDLYRAVRGAQRASRAAREPAGIVYRRIDRNTGRCYVGRCNSQRNYERRQRDHQRANPDADYEFRRIERAEPGRALREAEQRQIEAHGGPTNRSNPNGGTENRRNEIRCAGTGICGHQQQ